MKHVASKRLAERPWVPADSEALVARIAEVTAGSETSTIDERLHELMGDNRRIHEAECLNLNPATNVMNPKAEAALSSGLGSRPSLGYPGNKYEMGLEAIEEVEIIAAELAADVFKAQYAEVRVGSGALANLYTFMALAEPGDAIIVPPASIGGHVTHHFAGAAGLYGLDIHYAPIDPDRYTVDPDELRMLAEEVQPKIITTGGSLNLTHHPVDEIRAIADDVGAKVLFDAAHLSGPIAGGSWPNPLLEGAHVMTMSTYKSLGGPPSGLLVTNDAVIAERVDAIAYPGLTANFDAAKTAALAITMLDWKAEGAAYASTMSSVASLLAAELETLGVPVHSTVDGHTYSHAFAIDAREYGGGHEAALQLRQSNLLASAIGLPVDDGAGLRIGLNEPVRWGVSTEDVPELAMLIAAALEGSDPQATAAKVTDFRSRFQTIHFIR